MDSIESLALDDVGGGANTTRVAIECADILVCDGCIATVLDAAYPTQGPSKFVTDGVAYNVTELCLDTKHSIADGLSALDHPVDSHLAFGPVQSRSSTSQIDLSTDELDWVVTSISDE